MKVKDILDSMLEPYLLYSVNTCVKPWALAIYGNRGYGRPFVEFRKFLEGQLLEGQLYPSVFTLECKELHQVVFGSLIDMPLLLHSGVPGVAEIAKQRLFHHV